jgi:protein-disulfide isomerase
MSDRSTSALLVAAVLAGILITVIYLGQESRTELARLREQLRTLSATQDTIRSDVSDALRRQATSTASTTLQRDVILATNNAPFKGNENAPVTLVAFTDFQSSDCGRFSRETLPQLERDYIAPGKLKYVFRSFPDEAANALALSTQQAADCAGDQGKFWQMHDRLFAGKPKLKPDDMPAHARALGLDRDKFMTCFDAGLHMPAIQRDISEGQKNGVTSTPTFFLGPTSADRVKLHVTKIIKGAPPYTEFKDAIDSLLGSS